MCGSSSEVYSSLVKPTLGGLAGNALSSPVPQSQRAQPSGCETADFAGAQGLLALAAHDEGGPSHAEDAGKAGSAKGVGRPKKKAIAPRGMRSSDADREGAAAALRSMSGVLTKPQKAASRTATGAQGGSENAGRKLRSHKAA